MEAQEFEKEYREYLRRKKHTERDKQRAVPLAPSVTRDDDDYDEEQCPCTEETPLDRPFQAGLKCAAKSISNFFTGKHGHCWEKLLDCAHCYKNIFDYVGHYVQAHMIEAEVQLMVVEDVELDMQLEVEAPLSVSLWGTIDFYPPGAFVTSFAVSESFAEGPPGTMPFGFILKPELIVLVAIFSHPGWVINGDAAQKISEQHGKEDKSYPYYDRKESKEGDTKFGFGAQLIDAPPLSLQLGLTLNGGANITLPGMNVKLAKGDFVKMDLLHDDDFHYNLHPKVEYRDAKVVLKQDPSLDVSIQLGPRVTINLASYNTKSKFFKTFVRRPVDIGARVDLLRLDMMVKEANNVDEKCMPGNTSSAMSLDVIFRQGMSAWFQLGPVKVDTSNIGKLDKGEAAIPGLYVSNTLYKHCTDTGFVHSFKDVSNRLVESLCDAANEVGRAVVEGLAEWFAEHPTGPTSGKPEPIVVTTKWDRDRMMQDAQIDASRRRLELEGSADN
ncbi:hypothetical protein LTR15_002798 [Elasticomyces elasticus]|nr:hypothetical protein LTR15_002798 [Elasticomyces elasticus]